MPDIKVFIFLPISLTKEVGGNPKPNAQEGKKYSLFIPDIHRSPRAPWDHSGLIPSLGDFLLRDVS